MNYVIQQLSKKELLSFFGEHEQLVIKYFIYKSLLSQPELLPKQANLPIQIPKEHIEQWVVQALQATPIGAGSYPIDVYSIEKKWGADIKMISAKMNNNHLRENVESGETSLAQKFKDTGSNLDSLFAENKFEVIKDEWLQIYYQKYQKVINALNIKDIYYFFVIRGNLDFYLVGMKIDTTNIANVTVNKESKRLQSVCLNNFIDKDLGTVRIYKAKKRLELRLFPAEWEKRNNYIKFSCNFIQNKINLFETIKDESSLHEVLSNATKVVLSSQITIQ